MSKKLTKRITLDLSEPFFDRLENLQSLVAAESKASLIRQALQLYEFVAKSAAQGAKFQKVAPTGEAERIIFLDLEPPG